MEAEISSRHLHTRAPVGNAHHTATPASRILGPQSSASRWKSRVSSLSHWPWGRSRRGGHRSFRISICLHQSADLILLENNNNQLEWFIHIIRCQMTTTPENFGGSYPRGLSWACHSCFWSRRSYVSAKLKWASVASNCNESIEFSFLGKLVIMKSYQPDLWLTLILWVQINLTSNIGEHWTPSWVDGLCTFIVFVSCHNPPPFPRFLKRVEEHLRPQIQSSKGYKLSP